jgi:hypothetical protein
MLIGAGVGAAAGMLFAPPALCGSDDTECSVIVRTVIGIPALAGGIGVGVLVDGLSNRSADCAIPRRPYRQAEIVRRADDPQVLNRSAPS